MTDAIDTLLLAADKKSEDQPMAIGQPLSSAAAEQDAPQPQHARSEQPEHPVPKGSKHIMPSPNKPTDAAPALTAPMLPIPTTRHLPSHKRPNAALTFPEKLMHMMTYAEAQCATDPNFCVAWTHGGSAFVVQDPDAFTKDVVPRFFKATKFASFTRKLYRWGFRQINRGSTSPTDPMIFSNDNFHRDHKCLMANMRSTTNKKQKLNNAPTNNGNPALPFPLGLGMGFNNFSALQQMDGPGMMSMPGMAAMAGMGMAFPPGMAMSMMQNNAAMMMPATVTAGTNTPDGGAGMAAGSGTISPNSGVARVSAGTKRKAQEDILDSLSLDPTKAPGWNQLPSEERIRILQQALDTTATRFAAVNAEQQQAVREDSFGSAVAPSTSMPSNTPPTAHGSSLPHLDQLQNFQQELMFNQGQQRP